MLQTGAGASKGRGSRASEETCPGARGQTQGGATATGPGPTSGGTGASTREGGEEESRGERKGGERKE